MFETGDAASRGVAQADACTFDLMRAVASLELARDFDDLGNPGCRDGVPTRHQAARRVDDMLAAQLRLATAKQSDRLAGPGEAEGS